MLGSEFIHNLRQDSEGYAGGVAVGRDDNGAHPNRCAICIAMLIFLCDILSNTWTGTFCERLSEEGQGFLVAAPCVRDGYEACKGPNLLAMEEAVEACEPVLLA